MLLLIDGYNLLHQSDLMGRGRGERWLQRARERLLRQLQRHLDDSLAPQTCIVFDAECPPPDRPHEYFQFGIRVLYAVGYPEADDLVEELIAQHAAPQRLTVVSSDHRLQRAARRRRAHAFDSDTWYQRLLETGPQLGIRWPPDAPPLADTLPAVPEKMEGIANEREVEAWIRWFEQAESSGQPGGERTSKPQRKPLRQSPSNSAPPPGEPKSQPQPEPSLNLKPPSRRSKRSKKSDRAKKTGSAKRDQPGRGPSGSRDARLGSPDKQLDPSLENPFPEGYGEDLLEEDE